VFGGEGSFSTTRSAGPTTGVHPSCLCRIAVGDEVSAQCASGVLGTRSSAFRQTLLDLIVDHPDSQLWRPLVLDAWDVDLTFT
jgi:hypothetical protein